MKEETYQIYKAPNVAAKGLTATRWEIVSKLKIGEAVRLPKEARFRMITLAGEHGVSIRTFVHKDDPDRVEIVRVPFREKKKSCRK
jgi:hypothetical protein